MSIERQKQEVLAKWSKEIGLLTLASLVFQPLISDKPFSLVTFVSGLFLTCIFYLLAIRLLVKS